MCIAHTVATDPCVSVQEPLLRIDQIEVVDS
jgi:hypothetical protein